jgi:hypothetical protein
VNEPERGRVVPRTWNPGWLERVIRPQPPWVYQEARQRRAVRRRAARQVLPPGLKLDGRD